MPWQEDPTLRVDGRPAEAFPVRIYMAKPAVPQAVPVQVPG